MPLHHNRSDVEFAEPRIGEDLVFAALNVHLQNIDLLTEEQRENINDFNRQFSPGGIFNERR